MWLADTSVWIEHLRRGDAYLSDRLRQGNILIHPAVCGELACGSLKDRATVLEDLNALPSAVAASDSEVLSLIESLCLWGRGLGWVDAHLVASAMLSHCKLWTLDNRLAKIAAELGLA